MWTALLCIARIELGLTTDEFYALVPRTFAALVKFHRAKVARDREHMEFMIAQNTLWTMYAGMHPPSEPVELRDLMPSHRNRKPPTQEEKNAAFTARIREFNKQVLKARS